MRWYKMALRKHLMRFDPRVVISTEQGDTNIDAILSAYISSSIIKGLDIAGFVSQNINISNKAVEIAKQQNVDLYILPGQIYETSDGFNMIIYNTPDNIPEGSDLEQIIRYTKQNHLPTLVYNLGKQKSTRVLKLGKMGFAPTFVEIFNSKSYGYLYIPTNTYEVVSSGAETPSEIEQTNIYSHVPRKDMEKMKIIPENFGINYTPTYLTPQEVPV